MLHLDYRDARPIYEQVKDGLRKLMVTGVIQEGEKLPSVRALASSLAINPNTIQKAYEALEAEGYVYSVAGKGSFAAPHTGVDDQRRTQLLEQLDGLVKELAYLGVSADEVCGHIREKEVKNHD
ncbi:MAG: GntR family transcriptional regulator [Oscillospiraceae bacterium]|nr:GntR family transcriptional regulator [Oscillospiraceae bacterium]